MIGLSAVALLLLLVGVGIIFFHAIINLPEELLGNLSAGLITAAAVLIGVISDRWLKNYLNKKTRNSEREKIKYLVISELVDVAFGYVAAKNLIDVIVKQPKGNLSKIHSLEGHILRQMMLTDSLGEKILVLDKKQVEILSVLKISLAQTTSNFMEIINDRNKLNIFIVKKLKRSLQNDMKILAEAFKEFSPKQKLQFDGKEPELASKMLNRLSER